MKLSSIRARMLLAALIPVLFTVVIMVGVFWSGRVSDLGSAHQQQARLLVQKVALASEYGIFSGNVPALQSVWKWMTAPPRSCSAIIRRQLSLGPDRILR